VKHIAQPLKSSADGGLTEKKPLCCAGDIALLREHGEDDEEIEVGLS
jgi:hypothetical protein